jgi:hypothetical protein
LAFREHRRGQTVAEAATARMRPEWQERLVVSTVAEYAAFRARPKWQEWHFVSPGGGRRWPTPQPSVCGQSRQFVSQTVGESATGRVRPEWQEWNPGEGRRWNPHGIRNGPHASRVAGVAFPNRWAKQAVAVFATARMRSEWQEWHFVSPREATWWPIPHQSACGQSGRSGML